MSIRGIIGGLVLSLAWATVAKAEPARRLELSASFLIGGGAGDQFEDSSMVRYGLALGGRAGVTLPARVYLGASFVHFNGSDSRTERTYSNTLDAELGYDFRLLHDLLVIRPQLALGAIQAVTLQPDNRGYPLVGHAAPGVLVGLRWSPLFVSAEVRRDFVLDDSWPDSTTALLGVGVLF